MYIVWEWVYIVGIISFMISFVKGDVHKAALALSGMFWLTIIVLLSKVVYRVQKN